VRPASLAVLAAIVLAVFSASAAGTEESSVAWPHAASHAGRIEGDRVLWQSTFCDNAGNDPNATRLQIDLARPLEGVLDGAGSPGVSAVVDGRGAILAFAIDPHRLPGWADAVTVTLRAPLARDGDAVVLTPPIAAGDAVQRVELSGDGDLRFEPAPSDGFVRNAGSWSAPGISASDRRATNAELGLGRAALDESPIYLKATTPALDRGIRGRALTAQERARTGLILAAVAFVLLIAACAAGYRRLEQDARIEQAEVALREEFEKPGAGTG